MKIIHQIKKATLPIFNFHWLDSLIKNAFSVFEIVIQKKNNKEKRMIYKKIKYY